MENKGLTKYEVGERIEWSKKKLARIHAEESMALNELEKWQEVYDTMQYDQIAL